MSRSSFVKLRRYPPAGDPFALRVTQLRDGNPGGEHILYHARSARRVRNNIALDYARTFGLPVIMAEWLDEPHLSPRIEAFIRAGAARSAAEADVDYRFEPDREVIARARFVITDEFPTLPIPPYATHVVDGNGILPVRAIEKEQYSAKFFRDKAFRLFEQFWSRGAAPASGAGSFLPAEAAGAPLDLDGYADRRNGTGLSPAIHFGHVGAHDLASAVLHSGAREEDIDAFLEQLMIRRELAFNMCFYNRDFASLAALPAWAMRTLDAHRHDRRKPCYSYEELERAETHDEVWNLAQRQLVACGTIHNYLRMLWGKKIIEWSASPEEAHTAMVRLHDVYALDGRDPNTHAGILWCFGKHDRPWAPERPIFGTIRWMSSEQTRKKVRLAEIADAVARCDATEMQPGGDAVAPCHPERSAAESRDPLGIA
jgi:deoxyribodipyrimidine photo-lyase